MWLPYIPTRCLYCGVETVSTFLMSMHVNEVHHQMAAASTTGQQQQQQVSAAAAASTTGDWYKCSKCPLAINMYATRMSEHYKSEHEIAKTVSEVVEECRVIDPEIIKRLKAFAYSDIETLVTAAATETFQGKVTG